MTPIDSILSPEQRREAKEFCQSSDSRNSDYHACYAGHRCCKYVPLLLSALEAAEQRIAELERQASERCQYGCGRCGYCQGNIRSRTP